MKFRRIKILLGILLFSITSPVFAEKFVSFSDIHFTPFADCHLSIKPCPLITKLRTANPTQWDAIFAAVNEKEVAKFPKNTNYLLLKSTLNALKQINQKENPQFGLILGDFLAHNYRKLYIVYSHDLSAKGYEAFVQKTLAFLTEQIHQVFPHTDLYPAVGNNDSYTGDYTSDPNGKFFRETAITWANFISDKTNRDNLLKTFPKAGYYAVTVPADPKLRIIILNTVLFSRKATKQKVAAENEFRWLHDQLVEASAQKQNVYLAFHIPMGIDAYATYKQQFGKIHEFWQTRYTNAFEAEIEQFPGLVKNIFPAHIHRETFQFILLRQVANIPIAFTPSISPVFGNNPSIKVFTYAKNTGQLQTRETYFYPAQSNPGLNWEMEYSLNRSSELLCANLEKDFCYA